MRMRRSVNDLLKTDSSDLSDEQFRVQADSLTRASSLNSSVGTPIRRFLHRRELSWVPLAAAMLVFFFAWQRADHAAMIERSNAAASQELAEERRAHQEKRDRLDRIMINTIKSNWAEGEFEKLIPYLRAARERIRFNTGDEQIVTELEQVVSLTEEEAMVALLQFMEFDRRRVESILPLLDNGDARIME